MMKGGRRLPKMPNLQSVRERGGWEVQQWSRDLGLNPSSFWIRISETLELGANHSVTLGLVFFPNWNGFLLVLVMGDMLGV